MFKILWICGCKFIKEYRRILHERCNTYKKSKSRDGSKHERYWSNMSLHDISNRYHRLYQYNQRVQEKPPQIIYSFLGVLQ